MFYGRTPTRSVTFVSFVLKSSRGTNDRVQGEGTLTVVTGWSIRSLFAAEEEKVTGAVSGLVRSSGHVRLGIHPEFKGQRKVKVTRTGQVPGGLKDDLPGEGPNRRRFTRKRVIKSVPLNPCQSQTGTVRRGKSGTHHRITKTNLF